MSLLRQDMVSPVALIRSRLASLLLEAGLCLARQDRTVVNTIIRAAATLS